MTAPFISESTRFEPSIQLTLILAFQVKSFNYSKLMLSAKIYLLATGLVFIG